MKSFDHFQKLFSITFPLRVLKIEFLNHNDHNDSIAVAMWLIFMITLIYFICRAGIENISVMFAKPDKRASWEESFNEAKQKLGK